MSRSKWIACAICATTFLVAIASSGIAATLYNISQVKVSPDLRRVVVKTNGPIREHVVSSLDRPPRLVIDMAGVRPGDFQPAVAAPGRAGLDVRVSATGSGSRLVLDFRGSSLPEYKIRRVDNYLMVFLGDWTPSFSQVARTVAGESSSKLIFQATPPKRVQPIRVPGISRNSALSQTISEKRSTPAPLAVGKEKSRSEKFGLRPGALSIKSAQVNDDTIILQIANRDRPGYLYRVELAVDLDRQRLSLANIESIADKNHFPVQLTTKPGGPARRPLAGTRIGPRKNPSALMVADKDTLEGSRLSKNGMTAHSRWTESHVQGPRKNDPPPFRLTSPGQSRPQKPSPGYWSTAATMFQDNREDWSRTIFPRAIGRCFYLTELD